VSTQDSGVRVGRIRRKLAAMLAEHGFIVEPAELQVNHGYNNKYWDCCSWCGKCTLVSDGFDAHVYSWSPMSDLVRRGFTTLQEGRRDWNLIPVGVEGHDAPQTKQELP